MNFAETETLPPLLITAVGSLPHIEAGDAVDLVLRTLKNAPHAPQLPRSDPREQMWVQFSEGLPRFHVDPKELNYYFDTSGDPLGDIEGFYAAYLEIIDGAAADQFAVGADYGRGIRLFLERLSGDGGVRPFVKVQVTGPLSLALTVTDEKKTPIFYHPSFRDVVVKGIGLKAVWLVDTFRAFWKEVIVFFDEPILSAYGSSALLSVSRTDVIDSLNEVMSMTLNRGGIPGVHCCGNTDWGMIMETDARIINFDAVDYLETPAIYAANLNAFLGRGGVLAWGAVPNTEEIEEETAEHVLERIGKGIESYSKAGVDRDLLLRRNIITPACGCAGLAPQYAEKVYKILADLEAAGERGLLSADVH